MKLVGLMPVRNEAWCLGLTLRAALQWCDEMVLFLHSCDDESRQIMADVEAGDPDRVNYFLEYGGWDEMRHRQKMLTCAREVHRASHIAIIDADEIICGMTPELLRSMISGMPTGSILHLPGYNLRNGIREYHANGIWGNRWFSTAFADDPRLSWSGDTFHHREPHGPTLQPCKPIAQGEGGVMHLWGASERRLRAKHALYKITERLRWPAKSTEQINATYNLWRTPHDCYVMYPQQRQFLEEWVFKPAPEAWWKPYAPWMKYLDIDREPWQIEECRKLVKKNGADTFKGLDLFGIA